MKKTKVTTAGKTMEMIREQGGICQVVERWQSTGALRHSKQDTANRATGVRIDLFGFIDIVACVENSIVGIQCTTKSAMSAHRKKILNECRNEALTWVQASGRIQVWGWYKRSYTLKSGKQSTAKVWDVKIQEITLADFAQEELI